MNVLLEGFIKFANLLVNVLLESFRWNLKVLYTVDIPMLSPFIADSLFSCSTDS